MQKALILVLVVALLISFSGCATLFYPDRIGTSPSDGRLDVLLFVVQLLLFWPGLVVDFVSGAIWVPYYGGPEGYYMNSDTGEIMHFEVISGELMPGEQATVKATPVVR